MTTVDPPAISDDWVGWCARVDERLRGIERHGATKADLANLKSSLLVTMVVLQVSIGGLIVAAIKLLP